MAELPTELYDLVARLDHAAAVYNWPDCTEAARKVEALHARVAEAGRLYEELRAEIDGGSESMTHADALETARTLGARIAELEAERASLLEAVQKARERAARLELKHGRLVKSAGNGNV